MFTNGWTYELWMCLWFQYKICFCAQYLECFFFLNMFHTEWPLFGIVNNPDRINDDHSLTWGSFSTNKWIYHYGLNHVLQYSYIEALTPPIWWYLEIEPLGRYLGNVAGALRMGLILIMGLMLLSRDKKETVTLSVYGTQEQGGHGQPRKRSLARTRIWSINTLTMDFPAFRTVRSTCDVYTLDLWYLLSQPGLMKTSICFQNTPPTLPTQTHITMHEWKASQIWYYFKLAQFYFVRFIILFLMSDK